MGALVCLTRSTPRPTFRRLKAMSGMLKLVMKTSLFVWLATVPVAWADPLPNNICKLVDINGNRLSYAFIPNSLPEGPDRIGTLMEVGYARNNVAPPYKNNRHPLWSVKLLDNGITILTPQDTPEWRISGCCYERRFTARLWLLPYAQTRHAVLMSKIERRQAHDAPGL